MKSKFDPDTTYVMGRARYKGRTYWVLSEFNGRTGYTLALMGNWGSRFVVRAVHDTKTPVPGESLAIWLVRYPSFRTITEIRQYAGRKTREEQEKKNAN